MVNQGKMTKKGFDSFINVPEVASLIENPEFIPIKKERVNEELIIPVELLEALEVYPSAKANFDKLPPSHRKEYVRWIFSAKRPETILKRIAEAISLLERNRKLGMK